MRDIRCRLIISALLFAFFAIAQEQGVEVSGFRVPEYDEQGQMTSQLFGDHAEIDSDGVVKVEGVRVEFYREGDVFMEVASPYCFYNRKTGLAHSDAAVRADMEGVHLTGTGYLLDIEARTVQVLDESRVVIDEVMKQTGFDLEAVTGAAVTNTAAPDSTVISSKQLFLNYDGRSARFVDSVRIQDKEMNMECGQLDVFFSTNNSIDRAVAESEVRLSNDTWQVTASKGTLMYLQRKAFLEGGVQVKDEKMKMACATLELRFGENNEIDWIEALTDVIILYDGREAYAGKAVYDVTTDEFLLEDNPRLVEGRNMLLGDRIRFWRATGRMICEPSARVVLYPDEKLKTDFLGN